MRHISTFSHGSKSCQSQTTGLALTCSVNAPSLPNRLPTKSLLGTSSQPTWLNACMGMQWSRKQIYIEIISRHALKGNLAEPSPTLWSTFFFTGALSNFQHSIFNPHDPTFSWLFLHFIIVSKFQRANIHNKDAQWTYKTTILWKDIFSCLPTCQKKRQKKTGSTFHSSIGNPVCKQYSKVIVRKTCLARCTRKNKIHVVKGRRRSFWRKQGIKVGLN